MEPNKVTTAPEETRAASASPAQETALNKLRNFFGKEVESSLSSRDWETIAKKFMLAIREAQEAKGEVTEEKATEKA
ncbi:hypothetical protein N0V85_000818 [Neurospora sp. IMI 360204]|nr:hypothetical protein N0V85_000818 [Neurospora sp. IMI 360204]